jgi:hypothetical protein
MGNDVVFSVQLTAMLKIYWTENAGWKTLQRLQKIENITS